MLKVLLVDDDDCQSHIRATILRNAGLVALVASDVEGALAFLRAEGKKIGLVVSDHFLPGRSGADLVREMRLTLPLTPVLVLSGMPGIEDQYEGMNVNVRLKPMNPDELIRIAQESVSE